MLFFFHVLTLKKCNPGTLVSMKHNVKASSTNVRATKQDTKDIRTRIIKLENYIAHIMEVLRDLSNHIKVKCTNIFASTWFCKMALILNSLLNYFLQKCVSAININLPLPIYLHSRRRVLTSLTTFLSKMMRGWRHF